MNCQKTDLIQTKEENAVGQPPWAASLSAIKIQRRIMMKKIRFKSIKTSTALDGFVLIGSICLVILLISSALSKSIFDKQIKEDMLLMAKQVSEKIVNEISFTEKIIEELAANPITSDDEFERADVINFFESRAEELGFQLFFKVDKNGKGENLTRAGEKFDGKGLDWFEEAMQGKTYTSSIVEDVVSGGYNDYFHTILRHI